MNLSFFDKARGFVSEKATKRMLQLAGEGKTEELASLFRTISGFAPAKYHRESLALLADMIEADDPFFGFFKRIAREASPKCLEKLIQNLIVNFITLGRGIRDRKEKELGVHLPNFLVISPTMKCNLRCRGCYAGEYDTSEELTFDELDAILTEAKELGMFFFTFTGGEAFTRRDLPELWKKHGDCIFQVYTNGTLLDDDMVRTLADLGNVYPMVSVEGGVRETDDRRGTGTYDRVMAAFDRMKRAGMIFGFSATYTNESAPYLTSDDFLRTMIDRGCMAGWFFQYVPIGTKPDLSYMASPEERVALHQKVMEWRKSPEFPIFLGDFWNDGPFVDGCMAGGERYWHIIADGRVEPCVFVPFAADSVREKSLVDIARSPFFTAIRNAQPYGDNNLLRPCLILDHPEVLRVLIETYGAKPCHEGLGRLLGGTCAEGLDRYAQTLKERFDPLWENGEKERYMRSLEREDKARYREKMEKRAGVCR